MVPIFLFKLWENGTDIQSCKLDWVEILKIICRQDEQEDNIDKSILRGESRMKKNMPLKMAICSRSLEISINI